MENVLPGTNNKNMAIVLTDLQRLYGTDINTTKECNAWIEWLHSFHQICIRYPPLPARASPVHARTYWWHGIGSQVQ
jgi:hypothetical protein